jgi:hypothetical protein
MLCSEGGVADGRAGGCRDVGLSRSTSVMVK